MQLPDQDVKGTVAPGFEPLGEAFADVLAASHDHGCALHVRLDGRVVVDLWGGSAVDDRDAPWQNDTPTVIFSCTKGLVSILAGELVREGRLDLDAPVTAYWPEFDRHGKGSMPVRWLLSHRAGLPAVRQDLQFSDVADWDRIVQVLAEEAPLLPPGETHQYHALTFGWLVGEIIRRITGKGVAEFFAERIAVPLDVEAWIGVPDAVLPRIAQLYSATPPPDPLPLPPGTPAELAGLNDKAMTLGSAFEVGLGEENTGFNSDELRRAVIPGAGGIATAPALATIWSATVSNAEAVRLLNDEVIADMTGEQSSGEPAVPLPGPWSRWGSGFMLSSEARPFLTDASFGHDGVGGQVSFADPEYKVGFAFLTNDLQRNNDQRAVALVRILRDVLG
ncbi:MAG TPA: serine hydrolase domain-containing protein [Propionibacteriaceae bacterium]|nr:serine hydrolase domain-containing protein [Propionibacteriaceae bacterium]